ncbi:MAG: hypothetical protein JOZ80_14725 [Acidobacteriaceae bacterium]|nr:hypothetical protein [Acidobacteriaceae bacterium]
MKSRLIFISIFLLATTAFAVDAPGRSSADAVAPVLEQRVLVGSNNNVANDTVTAIVTVAPEIPRGPVEMLQDYRNQMTLTAQTLSSDLSRISLALRSGQITRAQAEYLIQQTAQLAAMQYQVFSALYDALAYEVAQVAAEAQPQLAPDSDSTVVVRVPPALCSATRTRSK